MTGVDTLVEGVLHVSPTPHPDVATRGIPEPLEGVFGAANNILSPKVVSNVSLHGLEVLDLVIIQIL
jgi:hypothetical protein